MKRRLMTTLALGTVLLGYFVFTTHDHDRSFADFITNHEFHPNNRSVAEVNNIPKRDRPDLAWEQNFLMTLDPALKRPAPERLYEARAQIKKHFDAQAKARTGSSEHPWIERGPSKVGGRTRAIMWDPNDASGKKVWAGGVSGGLWYNTDIYDVNEGWQKVDDFWGNLAITCIAADPNDPKTFYVGTGEGYAGASRGAGIWKSTDAGQTWKQLSATANYYFVLDLVVRNENGSSVLYFGCRDYYYQGKWHDALDGLLRSTDGGLTVSQVLPIANGYIAYSASDIELDANNNLWVGSIENSFNGGGGTILYSTDGQNWEIKTQRSNASRMELACAPSDANTVYALVEGSGQVKEIIKSTDGGDTWQAVSKPIDADDDIAADDFSRGQAWYDLIAAVDPNDANTLIVGGIDLFKSTDAGASWTQLSHWYGGFGFPYVHADQHAVVFKPGSSTDVLFGHDGGIDLSTNMTGSTPSFTNRNKNYNVTQFYAAAIHPEAGKDYFLAGSQDNGTQKFTLPGFGNTTEPTGGDGAYCFIDQTNGDIQITSYVQNAYYLSTNGGATFNEFVYDENSGRFINPAAYDSHQGILYTAVSSSKVGRFTGIKTGNVSRNDLAANMSDMASALTVSPYTTTSTTLFVGTGAGSLYKITHADENATTTNITGNNFPDGYINCIAMGQSEEHLLVVFSNYGVNSLYESKDGGNSWSSKEGDLPDMPIRWALYNPNNYDEVILATELGIWRSTNFDTTAPNWLPSNEGLANVRVDMLQIRSSDHEVIAATHGRGLFSSSGFSTEESLTASFTASSTSVFSGDQVTFTDMSTGSPTSWSWTFEGGTPETSSEQNPVVTYQDPGQFDVTLQVSNQSGGTDTKTVTAMITATPDTNVPNLAAVVPQGWDDEITLYTEAEAFGTNVDLSINDDALLAYALINSGVSDLSAAFNVEIQLDDEVVGTESWDEQINTNAIWYSYDFSLGQLSEGEHTISVTLDVDEDIEETNEKDNTTSKTFYVQQSCTGDNTLTELEGTITDGSGSAMYLNNRNCSWSIAPKNARSITLSFSEFDTEKSADFVNIYDGNNLNTPIAELSGTALPSDITVDAAEVVVEFITNNTERSDGWTLAYETEVYKPDLMAEILSAEQVLDELAVSVKVTNDGFADLDEAATITLYLSKDNVVSSSDTQLHAFNSTALASKTDQILSANISLTQSLEPGAYFVIAVADEENLIEEESEGNNESVIALDLIVLGNNYWKEITLYPNPANNYLNIRTPGPEPTHFELRDVSGKKISSGIFSSKYQLGMAGLPSGVYLLSLSNNYGNHQVKIVKH
ncbi:CUB domain-containing protein [Marinoscillum furvescens]|uniref:Putative secreted protein (Por secretion system target) n=1 Tax=Marinoscillum furvescens DSM 4134 TaxID=1122208 RepID=A0A3D9L6T5_MARFU|nr:CUB domain-containing protein [Marinoscillum furvescens]REE02069.1 putative secreted protein (Por secretion system target) [Marinoscillum furvescens DSM 4134]